jgi:hypothetical protein
MICNFASSFHLQKLLCNKSKTQPEHIDMQLAGIKMVTAKQVIISFANDFE